MRSNLMIALRATVVTLVVTGLAYPLALTGIAQAVFPRQADASLVRDGHDRVVGSTLIGQTFTNPAYLQGRPSAAGSGYDATSSSGSNLGPTSAKLRERAAADVARLRRENPEGPLPIPGDLVTTSASGLDPEVSPAAALWQAPRIARARGIDPTRVREIIERRVEGRELGFLGEPRVNVLSVNLALDAQLGAPSRATPTAALP